MTATTEHGHSRRAIVGITLENLGLALMVGGMLALGAFTAPVLFHNFPPVDAGRVMLMIFRRYDIVIEASLVFIIIGEFLRFSALKKQDPTGKPSSLHQIRLWLVMVLVATSAMSLFSMHPKMEAYQKAGLMRGVGAEGQDFDRLHKRAEMYYKTEMMLALAVLILSSVAGRRKHPVTP